MHMADAIEVDDASHSVHGYHILRMAVLDRLQIAKFSFDRFL